MSTIEIQVPPCPDCGGKLWEQPYVGESSATVRFLCRKCSRWITPTWKYGERVKNDSVDPDEPGWGEPGYRRPDLPTWREWLRDEPYVERPSGAIVGRDPTPDLTNAHERIDKVVDGVNKLTDDLDNGLTEMGQRDDNIESLALQHDEQLEDQYARLLSLEETHDSFDNHENRIEDHEDRLEALEEINVDRQSEAPLKPIVDDLTARVHSLEVLRNSDQSTRDPLRKEFNELVERVEKKFKAWDDFADASTEEHQDYEVRIEDIEKRLGPKPIYQPKPFQERVQALESETGKVSHSRMDQFEKALRELENADASPAEMWEEIRKIRVWLQEHTHGTDKARYQP